MKIRVRAPEEEHTVTVGKVLAGLEAGVPEVLFEVRLARAPNNPLFEYDVTADGKRFLLDNVASGSSSAPLLNAVVNWDAEPKK